MCRWIIFRREFYPCLWQFIKEDGRSAILFLICILVVLATAIGMTLGFYYDVIEVEKDDEIALKLIAIILYLIAALFLIRSINETIKSVRKLLEEQGPSEFVQYRPQIIPNIVIVGPNDNNDGEEESSNPSGYSSAEPGSTSGAAGSRPGASGSTSGTSGYLPNEPQFQVAASASVPVLPQSGPVQTVSHSTPILPASVPASATPVPTLTESVPGLLESVTVVSGAVSAAQNLLVEPQVMPSVSNVISTISESFSPTHSQPQVEDSELRPGLDALKESAVYVYEELEVRRSQNNSEELKEISLPEEAGFKSIEEMHVKMIHRPIPSTMQEEQQNKIRDELYRTNSSE